MNFYERAILPRLIHAGMRQERFLPYRQRLVSEAFRREILVAAICHGVLLAARTVDPVTGRSVLYGRKTTALTWELERRAWRIARVTRFWDPDYYRTYVEKTGDPIGYMSVQAEVTRALQNPGDFRDVAVGSTDWRLKTSWMMRDSASNARPAFVVAWTASTVTTVRRTRCSSPPNGPWTRRLHRDGFREAWHSSVARLWRR